MSAYANDPHDQRLALSALKRLQCTQGLSMESLQRLVSQSQLKILAAGDILWDRDAPGDFFALICEGFVMINRHSTNENETAVGLFGPSDAIGMIAALQGIPFPGTARALSPRTLVLRCFLKPNPQLAFGDEIHNWIRKMILRHEQVLRDKIDVLNGQTAEIRLLELLTQLTRRFGQKDTDGHCRVSVYLTRLQVSRFVNVRVETVIRILSRWNKAGWVTWTKNGILIGNVHQLNSEVYGKSL